MGLVDKISDLMFGSRGQMMPVRDPSGIDNTSDRRGDLTIPAPDPTSEDRERDAWQQIGQTLARQEDWNMLAAELHRADETLDMTRGGMSVADLIAYGARADVVGAVEHALIDGSPDSDAPLLAGIEALETVLAEYPDDHAIACVVAMAHIDLAWAWRGNGLDAQVPELNMEAFRAHMDRADDILIPHASRMDHSAMCFATFCAVVRSDKPSPDAVASNYEKLIDFNPLATQHMRGLGVAMLPRWYGSYERMELEARRTAARVTKIWGAGGYTWVMLDAIANDPQACAGLDVEYFTDGLRDILTMRPDQFTSNLLAAYCAITMSTDTGHDAADFNRAAIHKCADWIICKHMTELHPLIWAHAARGFDNAVRVRSVERFAQRGLEEARRVLVALFQPELANGQNVIFTEDGPVTQLR